MKIKSVSINEVRYITHRLAQEMLEWKEPIPDFNSRFPNILESCLAVPFQTFDKKLLYKGFLDKASILLYLMIKNHPFENGNKRIAITTLFYFLFKNKRWMKIDNQELYNFTVWIAESNPKLKDEVIAAIKKFIVTYLVTLK